MYQRTGLIVVAAGRGARFGGFKQLARVGNDPLFVHALRSFDHLPFAQKLVVLPRAFFEDGIWDAIRAEYPALADFQAVEGADTRAGSVKAGLAALREECEFVAVHDGARPLPPIAATEACLQALATRANVACAIVVSPVTDTIKRISADGRRIEETIDRQSLKRAETPQVARRALLAAALETPGGEAATDEAQALELAGHETVAIEHAGYNPKVTRADDLLVLNAYLSGARES